MVAVPQLAYHYELVCLLPLLPVISWLWKNSTSPVQKKLLIFITTGIALSQFQAIAAEKLFGAVHPHFIPGFGLFIVMIGVTIYKLYNLFGGQLQHGALPDCKSVTLHGSS